MYAYIYKYSTNIKTNIDKDTFLCTTKKNGFYRYDGKKLWLYNIKELYMKNSKKKATCVYLCRPLRPKWEAELYTHKK